MDINDIRDRGHYLVDPPAGEAGESYYAQCKGFVADAGLVLMRSFDRATGQDGPMQVIRAERVREVLDALAPSG